jgi:hypothetical protein
MSLERASSAGVASAHAGLPNKPKRAKARTRLLRSRPRAPCSRSNIGRSGGRAEESRAGATSCRSADRCAPQQSSRGAARPPKAPSRRTSQVDSVGIAFAHRSSDSRASPALSRIPRSRPTRGLRVFRASNGPVALAGAAGGCMGRRVRSDEGEIRSAANHRHRTVVCPSLRGSAPPVRMSDQAIREIDRLASPAPNA